MIIKTIRKRKVKVDENGNRIYTHTCRVCKKQYDSLRNSNYKCDKCKQKKYTPFKETVRRIKEKFGNDFAI